MRIFLARLLVVVTGVLIVVLAVVFAAIRNASPPEPHAVDTVAQAEPGAAAGNAQAPGGDTTRADPATAIARGRAVFEAQHCQMCHSFDGQGNPRSPLDDVGGRLGDKEIRLWIVAPQEMDPNVAKRGYQLPDEDLDALVAYLTRGRSVTSRGFFPTGREGTP